MQQVVRLLLGRRRLSGPGMVLGLLVLAGSMVWSHWHARPDPAPADAQGNTHVDRVIDGDTIVVSGNGLTNAHLRLLGVDAPEVKHVGLDHDAYFGPQARQYLTDKLTGRTVILKFDPSQKFDRYQRILAYVYLSDTDCANLDLVRDGYAYVDRRFKTMLQSQFDQLETQARAKRVGLWAGVKESEMPEWRQKWLAKKGVSEATDYNAP